MKSPLPLLTLFAFLTATLAFTFKHSLGENKTALITPARTGKVVIRCSPDWSLLNDWLAETDIPPIPGSGNHKWKITSRHDSAQFYFNQGMNMYYSFHIIESMASFKKAAKFEPGNAMVYWAQALAYGPNINDVGYSASPDALKAIDQAMENMGPCTEKEKKLIYAQRSRYSEDSTESRQKLNQRYADQMKKIYDKFPGDADVAALYADALMLQHPWDLWNKDGTPKPWTPQIRTVLEKLLVNDPSHPGANHYYIHVMEPSPYAYKALPSADRLGKLTPGLSHTVHMPSHIYLRTGHYQKGMSVNEAAVTSYKNLIPVFEPVTGNAFLYIIHNLHMQTNHALMTGQRAYAIKSALETANSIPVDYLSLTGGLGNAIQYIYMTPVLAHVRYGNWNELLAYPEPADDMIYAKLLYTFGKGMAQASTHNTGAAKTSLHEMEAFIKDSALRAPFDPFSAAIEGSTVALNLLAGTIALKEKKFDSAIEFFKKASATEEQMVYDEPRDWLLNPKHYLGNALLKAGDPAAALKVFNKDLENNRENGWALFGCWQALVMQHKTTEAKKMLARYRKAFNKADIELTSAVF